MKPTTTTRTIGLWIDRAIPAAALTAAAVALALAGWHACVGSDGFYVVKWLAVVGIELALAALATTWNRNEETIGSGT